MGARQSYEVDLADLDYDDPLCDRRPSDGVTNRSRRVPVPPPAEARRAHLGLAVLVTALSLAVWSLSLGLAIVG